MSCSTPTCHPRRSTAFSRRFPQLLRERGLPPQVVVTTSYDTALEKAFEEAGEAVEIVTYLANGRHRGRFCHIAPDGTGTLIDEPNTYATELSLDRNTVILKLHGQVERTPAREWESFVVTEDDYINYLAQTEIAAAVPVCARGAASAEPLPLPRLQDGRLEPPGRPPPALGRPALGYRSWAVQPEPKPLEREFWHRRDVDVLEQPFEEYAGSSAATWLPEPAGASA